VVLWEETKKIIKICSLTPPTACKSKWRPPQDHQEFDSSNEVRVTLLDDERDIIPQTRQQTRSPPRGDSRYDESTVSPTAVRAREVLVGKRLFCSAGKMSCYLFCHFCHVLPFLYGAERSCNLNRFFLCHSFCFS
jgi:hypothetical protein